jgi:hypothetical protein
MRNAMRVRVRACRRRIGASFDFRFEITTPRN